MRKPPTVFVMMSGGVDSSVAAALLSARGGSAFGGKESDFDVVGVYMRCWSWSGPSAKLGVNCNEQDAEDARRVAGKLGIPFYVFDFEKEYRRHVVDYMIFEYARGRTPNPDVVCNREIKFGLFLKHALKLGAAYVATGHYARVHKVGGKCQLLTGKDANKDQSYFLWTLTQGQLEHCLFPIGERTKPQVRELARKFGLATAEKEESQGICFIGEVKLGEFLHEYIPERRGVVMTSSGKIIGQHDGVTFYTIGQRQGLAIGGGIPYFVAQKDVPTNTLVVAEGPYDPLLYSRAATVSQVHWVSGQEPEFPLRLEARIRYRQPLQSCTVSRFNELNELNQHETHQLINSSTHQLRVVFDEPQRAVTPGQSVVFYGGEELVGGGVIQ